MAGTTIRKLWTTSRCMRCTLRGFRIGRFPVTVPEFGKFHASGGYSTPKYWAKRYGEIHGAERLGAAESVSELPRGRRQLVRGCRLLLLDWSTASYRGRMGACGARSGGCPVILGGMTRRSRIIRRTWYHPTPVGLFPKGNSSEGLCDMLGNVWEWCGDGYAPYEMRSQENPRGPKAGKQKVLRGGSWVDGPLSVRVSDRIRLGPTIRTDNIGFRCAGEFR
jgi:formylglycine-generating enzyme required for sulfatase activity